jgi:hypothetical protein
VAGGRVNIQSELRETETKGARGSLLFEPLPNFNIRIGGAYDDTERTHHRARQQPVLAERGLRQQPERSAARTEPAAAVQGRSITARAARQRRQLGLSRLSGFGTGYTAGQAGRSLTRLADPADRARQLPDADRLRLHHRSTGTSSKDASNYDAFLASAPTAGSSNTGANGGFIGEKVWAGSSRATTRSI